jgi:tripartite-type tricarboxylate transporter receptor subunit TctC
MSLVLNLRLSVFICGSIFALSFSAQAQPYPNKPIRMIVISAPGGSTDILSRAVGKSMTETLGQTIVLDNKPGGGGIIATETTAKAPPDGYTILLGYTSTLATGPHMFPNVGYDPRKDFEPIGRIGTAPNTLVVHPSFPAKTVQEFIAYAKANPGKINMASSGSGTSVHMSGEMFMMMTGCKMLHVPYKGAGPALTALLGGEVQAMVVPVVIALPHIKTGRLRPLGYSGAKRLPAIADVPTIGEAALPGFQMDTGWHALFAPAKTSAQIVNTVYGAVQKSLQVPAVREFLLVGGYDPTADPPAVFQKNFQNDLKRWGELVRLAKIDPI